jgi:hypothetical protein
MASTANSAPADTDLLCEKCGYILNGLNPEGNCPECGAPIAPSTIANPRQPSSWEQPQTGQAAAVRFLATTFAVVFQPTRFYRNITARDNPAPAQRFARIHWFLAAVLFGLTSWMHWAWYEQTIVKTPVPSTLVSIGFLVELIAITLVLIVLTTNLAVKLTAWEGAHRGYRLPVRVVMRALYFHAAHFLPVALIALITVAGYSALESRGVFQQTSAVKYLYVLCGEVIVSAIYLFNTYWIGMRNLMYANY